MGNRSSGIPPFTTYGENDESLVYREGRTEGQRALTKRAKGRAAHPASLPDMRQIVRLPLGTHPRLCACSFAGAVSNQAVQRPKAEVLASMHYIDALRNALRRSREQHTRPVEALARVTTLPGYRMQRINSIALWYSGLAIPLVLLKSVRVITTTLLRRQSVAGRTYTGRQYRACRRHTETASP